MCIYIYIYVGVHCGVQNPLGVSDYVHWIVSGPRLNFHVGRWEFDAMLLAVGVVVKFMVEEDGVETIVTDRATGM